MDETMTICAKCKHHFEGNPDANLIWYNHFCTAIERSRAIDPVTGEYVYVEFDEQGDFCIKNGKYKYCRDINKGNCPMFEMKECE